jgi:hypothetical protein
MDRTLLAVPEFEVDGGYLPGGDETAELAESLTAPGTRVDIADEPEVMKEILDASIYAAMLHP